MFEALGQIRANRVLSPIRIEIRVIRVQSSLLSHFFEGQLAKKEVFFRSENRFARIGPLSTDMQIREEHSLESINFFLLKLFGHPWDIPAKLPGYPAKKYVFPGFRGTYRTSLLAFSLLIGEDLLVFFDLDLPSDRSVF